MRATSHAPPETSEDELMPGTGALRSACKATRRPFSLVDITTGSLGQGLPDGVGIGERASGRPADGGLVSLPGVISRRKRVAPGLLAAAAR